jgi:predicted dehydrogenase
MASTLRTGVVGCGGLGPSEAKISHEMDGIELVGVVDVNIDSAQAVADELGVKAFSNHGDLFNEGLDAVLVVTPTWTHREICVEAANNGIAVFCEKPMALNLEDCDAMIEAADNNNVPLMLGFVMRYWPIYVELNKRLQNGDIGDLKLAWSTRLSGRPPVGVGEWRLDRKLVGGTWSSSVHELDLLLWMGGPVASVHGNATFGTFDNTDLEDTFISTLNYENGAIGSLHSSQIYPAGASNFGIAGTKGSIHVNRHAAPTLVTHDGKREEIETEASSVGMTNQLAAFYDCARNGTTPMPDGHDGRRALEVCLATFKSAEEGGDIVLPL